MPIAEQSDWKTIVRNKWLLWDTSGINRVIQYNSEDIFSEIESLGGTNVDIHMVELELLATNNKLDSLRRSAVLDNHFTMLPFKERTMNVAKALQSAFGAMCQPSPTDLYLGATLASYDTDRLYMVTENIRDFPAPYFNKLGFINLYADRGVCALTILSFSADSIEV